MVGLFRSLMRRTSSATNFDLILRNQSHLSGLSDANLTDHARDLRDRLLDGKQESELVADLFPLVREAARRRLGLEHRENQLAAGQHLLGREAVEMPTGEGKTLAATLALTLRAFSRRGVWLATANDYLARRDATTMRSIFELLGLSAGYLQSDHSPDDRLRAYNCDITYGTIREFGFDFLRDRLNRRQSSHSAVPLQRERFSIIVDEADSILLDDARTPLIISEPRPDEANGDVFLWADATGRQLTEELDFLSEPQSTKVWLTETGRSHIRQAATNQILSRLTLPEAYESVSRAIEADRTFYINRDYIIRDGKLVIVDGLTGRLAEGRQWQKGFQQTLEAANKLEITPPTRAVAQITVQAFLRGFPHLSGMTGTAQEAAGEFRRTFKMKNVVVPPFRACQRINIPPTVMDTRQQKLTAVVESVQQMLKAGRPVLIGTRDLNASAELSEALRYSGIDHQVLTANQEACEADLISRAGQEGTVTVSTSIAGRGTDIRLGPRVADRGGLHVIATDLFDASRIDRQLAGRCGRQGDPGSYQLILSLEDSILKAAWEPAQYDRLRKRMLSRNPAERLEFQRTAQRQIERRHRAARDQLLRSDRDRSQRHNELGFDTCLDDLES